MTDAPLTDLSRRSVLGAAGVAGLAALAVPATPADAQPLGRQGRLPKRVDVVVVGAGLAGLVATDGLARAGVDVLCVEARRRVGGRVLNHHLDGGGVIESGGAFIGPTQDRIAALAKRFGVRTFLEYNDGNSVYVSSTTGRMEYSGTVPPDPTILPDAATLLTRIDQMASEIDVSAPWAHPSARDWDAMSLGEFIRRNAVNSSGVGNLIKSWTQPGFGADPDELSLLYTLWYVACSGNEENVGTFSRNSDTADGAQERRFVKGSQTVPIRLARELGDHVALGAAVRTIEQRHGGVLVHTRRGTVRAKRVIVAAPPPLVLDIEWYPRLPTRRLQLMRHLDMGQLMKCDAVYKTPFWRDAGLNGFGVNDSGAARAVFDNSPASGDPGVLLAFVGGQTWRTYGPMSKDERREAVLAGFAAMFGDEALEPLDYVEHDWTKEQWTRGGPTAFHAPGTMVDFGPAIRTPFGRVHWAGTETATYWSGYMDGAVRSGERAAREVRATL
ncbi:flavin monoamine oxidase family protein [Nocardioides acrostichi]|uniref:FAD-dependent oxidoreductase n=1 Tax=Nocardioides acrostichi TaxID=2784339 RepID=A0A930YAL2_9ACTN|nr:FAD-dependent oxidoreductase [Nocardioides acrostichi]MBF4161513.1 FAD-dependent oxidoreductase [Nocardioides acrostichi]